MKKNILLWVMGFFYIAAGVNHFIRPEFYLKIMPNYLPSHPELVFLSGVAEVVLGVCILIPKRRVLSAWGIIALLVAVYPANLYMWMNNIQIGDKPIPVYFHYIRLAIQCLLIYWAYVYTKKSNNCEI